MPASLVFDFRGISRALEDRRRPDARPDMLKPLKLAGLLTRRVP